MNDFDLTNEEKLKEILKTGAPDLWAVKEAMETTHIDPDLILRTLYLVANVQRFTKWGKVSMLIQDGVITRIQQEQGFKTD